MKRKEKKKENEKNDDRDLNKQTHWGSIELHTHQAKIASLSASIAHRLGSNKHYLVRKKKKKKSTVERRK
jgi:hypothetical protein